MLRLVTCCAIALAGCYEPNLKDCVVRCATDVDCAPGQACRGDGWCTAPGSVDSCDTPEEVPVPGVIADAAGSGDAMVSVDAPPAQPCAPGCGGSCENGVCVIRCLTPGSCEPAVFCPATGPCTVVCGGIDSCHNGVRCGLGRCTVSCSGDKSCHKRARCELACACDVTCTGEESCKDEAWCQDEDCEQGRGCTSAPANCNAC